MLFAIAEYIDITFQPFTYTILVGRYGIIGAPGEPTPFIEENIKYE